MKKWQPIESAPKDGTHILLFIEGYTIEGWWGRNRWNVARLSDHGCGCCGGDNDPPTHWQELEVPNG